MPIFSSKILFLGLKSSFFPMFLCNFSFFSYLHTLNTVVKLRKTVRNF